MYLRPLAFICAVLSYHVVAVVLNISDPDSIRDAAATVAHGVQELYTGNKTGGVLGKFPFPPYYWWESGATWSGMISYWHFTGDESYVNVTHEAIVSQIGPTHDFILEREKDNTGNDDQAFWTLAAMSAAEYGFPQPPAPYPPWHKICDNVFRSFVLRWKHDSSTCGGGLRWHFTETNAGTGYKNTISNGGFFQLAARLARFTGDTDYATWAETVWDWTAVIGLMDRGHVFDGSDLTINCTRVNHNEWSYNNAMYLYGSAVMQNLTQGSDKWVSRTNDLMSAGSKFLYTDRVPQAPPILWEQMCEKDNTCNTDQFSMKAYMARWLATTAQLAPSTAGAVGARLRASAIGAAQSCVGGRYGNTCGMQWWGRGFDNSTGLGQQLSAMEVMYALLVNQTDPPSTLSALKTEDGTVEVQPKSKGIPEPRVEVNDPGHPSDPPGSLSGPQTFSHHSAARSLVPSVWFWMEMVACIAFVIL